ncbi:MAG TPA: carbohydrate ABC transporter permease [Melioribacteraceae bacterium]|nr:carbohydrate ABC transporter permease [Melioribacteraceae bacterium]
MKLKLLKKTGLYLLLIVTAIFLFFPIYWVVASSFKTREAISANPPTFYPSKEKTISINIQSNNRLFTYHNSYYLWLVNNDKLTGFYLKLSENFEPLYYVEIINNNLPVLNNKSINIKFDNLPIHLISDSDKEFIVLARLVIEENGKNSEILFSPHYKNNLFNGFNIYKNIKHKPVNKFYARLENYTETLKGAEATMGMESSGFLTYLKNSFIISILAVIGQILTSSFAAYGFARINFKGREFLFILLLATLMIPAQVTLVPLFAIYKHIGWINTLLPLIVPHFTAGAFNVFLIRQYMLTLPKELDESALIDGCSRVKIFYKIILPNCLPVLIVVGLFTFVATWQDVMGPLMYLDDPELRTVQLGLEYFRSPYIDNRHLLLTGSVISMLPIAIIFIIFQRYIMSGIATTGLKG